MKTIVAFDRYRAMLIGEVWHVTNPDGVSIREWPVDYHGALNAEDQAKQYAADMNESSGII